RAREVAHGWELRVVNYYRAVGHTPRMFVESATQHLAELQPGEECRRRRMRSDESLPIVLYERQEIGALLRREINLPNAKKEDRIKVVEVADIELFAACDASPCGKRDRMLRDQLRVGAD